MKNIYRFEWKPEQESQHQNKAAPEPYFLDYLSHLCKHTDVLINQQHDGYSQHNSIIELFLSVVFSDEDYDEVRYEHDEIEVRTVFIVVDRKYVNVER